VKSEPIEQWSLYDHLVFLSRAWILLIALPIACGAAAYFATSKTSSSAQAFIRVGTVYERGFIEPPNDVVARLSSTSFLRAAVADAPEMFPKGTDGIAISVSMPQTTALIEVVAGAPDETTAANVIRAVAKRLADEHGTKAEAFRASAAARLVEVEATLATLRNALGKEFPTMTDQELLRRQALLHHADRLEQERSTLKIRVDPKVSTDTVLLDAPTTATTRGGKKAGLLAAATGFAVTVLMLYLIAHLRHLRARSQPAPAKLRQGNGQDAHAEGERTLTA
jgi:hypothetical protein